MTTLKYVGKSRRFGTFSDSSRKILSPICLFKA
jgi:hypothetical protein